MIRWSIQMVYSDDLFYHLFRCSTRSAQSNLFTILFAVDTRIQSRLQFQIDKLLLLLFLAKSLCKRPTTFLLQTAYSPKQPLASFALDARVERFRTKPNSILSISRAHVRFASAPSEIVLLSHFVIQSLNSSIFQFFADYFQHTEVNEVASMKQSLPWAPSVLQTLSH